VRAIWPRSRKAMKKIANIAKSFAKMGEKFSQESAPWYIYYLQALVGVFTLYSLYLLYESTEESTLRVNFIRYSRPKLSRHVSSSSCDMHLSSSSSYEPSDDVTEALKATGCSCIRGI
jgi:hypothetical protein